jgi:hypothetical protein
VSRSKGGRPPFEITEKVIAQIEQLAGYGLTVVQIAAVIGCSETTMHAKKHQADVSEAFTRGRARAEAMIGKSLFEKAKAGEGWAVQWWEKTRAGRTDKAADAIPAEDYARLMADVAEAVVQAAEEAVPDEGLRAKLLESIEARWSRVEHQPASRRPRQGQGGG